MLRIICDYSLFRIIEDFKAYKLVLYAERKYKKPIEKLLTFVDVAIDEFVSDTPCESEKAVYDLLYENKDEIIVLVCKDDFQSARKILEGMGFQLGVNFKDICHYCSETGISYIYDPMLGYNLGNKNTEAEGFRIFGDLSSKGLRVLTLGGSTTDAYLYPFRSWSECLHDELVKRGVSNVVICGGTAGYRSSEELIKLIRDGFVFKPDVVINYSGINDCFLEEYPYINDYMRQMCDYINKTVKSENDHESGGVCKTTWGVKGSFRVRIEDMYSHWKINQSIIHAVCQVHGVRHITFLQPSLFNGKKWLSDYERSYALNVVYMSGKRYKRADFMARVPAFRRLAKEDIKNTEWLHDLSNVLDEEDAYIDMSHLNERGNQTIAKKIAEYISM